MSTMKIYINTFEIVLLDVEDPYFFYFSLQHQIIGVNVTFFYNFESNQSLLTFIRTKRRDEFSTRGLSEAHG